jgi:hypothetical protein
MPTTISSSALTFPTGLSQITSPGVKSVQSVFANPYGVVFFGDYPRSVNITISPVEPTKCVILYSTWLQFYVNGYTAFAMMTAKILNSTTLQLSQTYTSDTLRSVRIHVIEFD